MSKKIVRLNTYQKAVVDFRDGAAVCMACPGSGKTAVIVARILALLREGVKPAEILSLTFTKEGAREMTDRTDLKDVQEKVFSTFHSWCLGFIKREYTALPFKVKIDWHGNAAPLCLPLDACRTLAMICRRLHNVKWKDAQSFISKMKRRGISPAQALRNIENDGEEVFVDAYRRYDHALREKGVMDFDSIVIETANLLKSRADVRERNQFRYVQVDEGQDTDSVQWGIIKSLTERHGNALAVGDPNQGMYGWRGSESNLVEYFTSLFPDAKIFPLPVNYRSTQAIVAYCKEIAPDKNETIENLSTPNALGVEPTFRHFVRDDEEARAIIVGCQDLGNTVILARTNRQLAAFENECGERGLRYKLLGKSGFWGQHEVKDMLAITGAVVLPTDNNILRMLTSRCEATKYLRKSDTQEHLGVGTLLKQAQQDNVDSSLSSLLVRFSQADQGQNETVRNLGHMLQGLRSEVRSMDGITGMRRIVDRFGVLTAYEDDDDKDENIDNDPRDNIMKLVEYAGKRGGVKQFFDWALTVQRALRARTNCLTLSTIHQSKGKEWKIVFVAGVNQDVLPHIKGDPLEEQRIYFVACSRAADRLNVSCSGIPSPFIKDRLPDDSPRAAIDPWAGFELLQ